MISDINPSSFPEQLGHFFISGPAGKLEILTEPPKSISYEGIAIICHPNPLQSGSMTNKVVHTLAKAYQRCGLLSVRFNYRGVGQSQGTYGHTEGEIQDLMAVIEWVKQVDAHAPLWLAGFSFGAYIAAQGAKQHSVEHLISVAPAIHLHPFKEVESLTCPWLVIQGDEDEVVSYHDVLKFVEAVRLLPHQRIKLEVLNGVGHFFHGRLVELREKIMADCQSYL